MFDDKDRLTDNLITQKYIANGYNHAALEAANSQLMDAFTGILRDEHQLQHEIFIEMNSRGWYQPKTANMNDLTQHLNKWNQELQKVQNTAARSTVAQQQALHGNIPQQHAYQGNIPQYSYQTGVGMPQQMGMPQSQTMYRPPQSPMI